MRINSTNNISFGAGKTKILSDFDGTYMPKEFNHDTICSDKNSVDRNNFKNYFGEFDTFLNTKNKNGDKPKLTVTTGRNLHEFNYYVNAIKKAGLSIPIPDSLIITNGGDEFSYRLDNDYFKSDEPAMFDIFGVNTKKRDKLKQFFVSYEPHKAQAAVKNFLDNLSGNPNILRPNTHQGMYGYKDYMTLQENIEKKGNITNYVSIRKDGLYQMRITAPRDSEVWSELKTLPDYLKDEGFETSSEIVENDWEAVVNSAKNPNDWNVGTSVNIKPATKGKVPVLDKFHHVKLEVSDIIENNSNDLIIAAGDGANDLNMLDLSNYIDGMKSSEDFSNPKFKEDVSKLPLVSIFVKNSEKLNDKIYKLEKDFNFDGTKRFIIVDKNDPKRPSTLLEAIKSAQEEYSKHNPIYKQEYK